VLKPALESLRIFFEIAGWHTEAGALAEAARPGDIFNAVNDGGCHGRLVLTPNPIPAANLPGGRWEIVDVSGPSTL
jgi:hypothetical protein